MDGAVHVGSASVSSRKRRLPRSRLSIRSEDVRWVLLKREGAVARLSRQNQNCLF